MKASDRIKKEVDLLEHVKKRLWQDWKEKQWKVFFTAHKDDHDASLCVWVDRSKWYKDFSEHLGAWTIIDFEIHFQKIELKDSIKYLCETYWIEWEKTEFKKSPKRADLAENFENYRMTWNTSWFSRWLEKRWVGYDQIQQFKDPINELAKEFWFCENVRISGIGKDSIYKDVIIFPCLNWDDEKTLTGAKIRRTDGEKFIYKWWALKSVSIWKPKDYKWEFEFSTWIIYDKISDDYVIIVEWEADYAILKILGFESVIWNLWGVSAWADKIQSKVKKVKKVISFYDNDPAWIKANKELVKKIWRPVRRIIYPEIEWKKDFDVNDLFNMWYTKEDFEELLENSEILDLETAKKELEKPTKKEETPVLYKDRFFYNNTKMEYFDVKDFNFKWSYTLARHLFVKPKELEDIRMSRAIPTYEWICYLDGWKKWYYNLLDKSKMIHPSKKPEVHPEIKFLIDNLCNNNVENALWLLEAIIYKYTHLNDVLIPAVVFHGVWWTWKGLFVKLLEQIFWENNTQIWLTQDSLESRFSAYSWQKLIVEFQELSVDGTAKWKKNMQKLKTFIMAEKIMIEKKWQDAVWAENIAWFIMSSNEAKPVQLDSVDSWNRRWTIIKTWESIDLARWRKIARAIEKKENIENLLAWLLDKFPEIKTKENILPLDNEDKRDLEYLSESVWNLFFKWVEEKYPDINKITNHERNYLLDMYQIDMGEKDAYYDDRYKIQYFNSNLSVRYKITSLKINWKTERWYRIEKSVKWCWHFPEWKFEKEAEKK